MAEEFIKSLEALQQIRRKQDYSFTRLGRLSEAYRLNQSAGTLSESVSASVVLAAQHVSRASSNVGIRLTFSFFSAHVADRRFAISLMTSFHVTLA